MQLYRSMIIPDPDYVVAFCDEGLGFRLFTTPEELIPFISIALANPNSDKFHVLTGWSDVTSNLASIVQFFSRLRIVDRNN